MKRIYIDVDTQEDFCSSTGTLFVNGAREAVNVSAKLILKAVYEKSFIFGSVDSHSHDAWEFSTNDNRGPNGEKPNFPPHCVKGTKGWLKIHSTLPEKFFFIPNMPGFRTQTIPQGTQGIYFEKEVYSLFSNPNAINILNEYCPTQPVEFIVFGVATDYCVKTAVLGLLDWIKSSSLRKESSVIVITDAIAAVTEVTGVEALKEMRDAGAIMTSSQKFLFAN